MSRLAVVVLSSFVLLVGCKKEAPAELPPAVQKEVDKAVKAAVPEVPKGAEAAGPGASQKLNCEKLVSAELRAKYFPGATMTQEPQCPGCPEACKLSKEKDPAPATLMFDCRDRERPNWFQEMTKMADKVGTPVEGLGRFARGQMKFQLLWAPEKYDCVVSVTWMDGGERLLPLAKELDAALTPEGLGI